jgi:GNAT superfamily N-acetyltransferase
MIADYPLTRAHRLRLAQAFACHTRVDLTIDCVIEGQMGRAYVNDPDNPNVMRIQVGDFFNVFAGDAVSPAARELVAALPPWQMVMPSPPSWMALLDDVHGSRATRQDRYSFLSDTLSVDRLRGLLAEAHLADVRHTIRPLNVDLLREAAAVPDHFLTITDFDSPEDFIERGLGYCAIDGNVMVGAAYSSLVASRGIEVSLYVEEGYRRQGIATALACHLLIACLEHNCEPHWDAANPESCALALKLGYTRAASYEAVIIRGDE